MHSIAQVPHALARRIRPAVEATLAPEQLERIFAGVEFRPLEPYAAPEPSIGAAVRLASGHVATLAYGKGSHLLRVDLPESDSVNAFLREVTLPSGAITWRRREGPPRVAAEPRRDVAASVKALPVPQNQRGARGATARRAGMAVTRKARKAAAKAIPARAAGAAAKPASKTASKQGERKARVSPEAAKPKAAHAVRREPSRRPARSAGSGGSRAAARRPRGGSR